MKKIVLVTFFIVNWWLAYSQDQAPSHTIPPRPSDPSTKFWDWKKVFFGGNVGAQFGSISVVDISPRVGYRVTERLSVGIGGTYIHYSYKAYNFTSNIYGGRAFSQFGVTENIFAYGEYEILNLERYDIFGGRINVENIYIGGGFKQPIGARSSYFIMALWNLNQSTYSPYSNPILRMGFNVGF